MMAEAYFVFSVGNLKDVSGWGRARAQPAPAARLGAPAAGGRHARVGTTRPLTLPPCPP